MTKEAKPVPTGLHTFTSSVKGWDVVATCNLPDPTFTLVKLRKGDTHLTIIPVMAPNGGFDCSEGDDEPWLENRNCDITPTDIYTAIGKETRKMGLELVAIDGNTSEVAAKLVDALRKALR
jgi:hypothetical protein